MTNLSSMYRPYLDQPFSLYRLEAACESTSATSERRDDLLANLSHELRTPLTAIMGFADLLKEEFANDLQHEFLSAIKQNSNRLLETIDAFSDIASLRLGTVSCTPTLFDLNEEVEDTAQRLSRLAREKDLVFEYNLADTPVLVFLDITHLGRILHNLIHNAIKFTNEGSIRVEVTRNECQVHLRVCDTGIGIDAAFLPHLFDAFKQESTGVARSYEGNGLGLSIARQLIRQMGGEIEVESQKGEGTVFTVSFPLYPSPGEQGIEDSPLLLQAA